MAITHLMVSAKADGADDSLVQAGDWNDDHVGTADPTAHAIGGADHTGSLTAALHGTFTTGDLHSEYVRKLSSPTFNNITISPGGVISGPDLLRRIHLDDGATYDIRLFDTVTITEFLHIPTGGSTAVRFYIAGGSGYDKIQQISATMGNGATPQVGIEISTLSAASGDLMALHILDAGSLSSAGQVRYGLRIDDFGGSGTLRPIYQTGSAGNNFFGSPSEFTGLLTASGGMAMGDSSITGIDTLVFTNVDGTIAGIANKNLLDKTAVETITRGWLIDGSADEVQLAVEGVTTVAQTGPTVRIRAGAGQSASVHTLSVESSGGGLRFWANDEGQGYFLGAVGIGVTPALHKSLNLTTLFSNQSQTHYGAFLTVDTQYTSAVTIYTAVGVACALGVGSSNNQTRPLLQGGLFQVVAAGSGTLTRAVGGWSEVIPNSATTETVVTDMVAHLFTLGFEELRTTTGTYAYISEEGVTLDTGNGGTLPNQYGLRIGDLTLGTTLILPIYQEGVSSGDASTRQHNRLAADTIFGADAVPVTTVDIRGGIALPSVVKTGAYTATLDDYLILCDASGGAFTVTLPAASTASGLLLHIKKTDSSGNAVTVDGNASETVDGALTQVINVQYNSLMMSCDGSNWHII